MAIRVLLVDDHRILRDALRLALAREEGIEVVAEAGTAAGRWTARPPCGPTWWCWTSGCPT